MEIFANAKINWDLKVLGKRPDGFHELDTVMVTIGLRDRLTIQPAERIAMTCSQPDLPTDENNLVIKAAKALAEAAGVKQGAQIHLDKQIPHGGGLGGGSSDAASTLVALNRIWGLHWHREELARIAGGLGSDVPFFLWGGWRRCRGRGEIVEPLEGSEAWPDLRIFLILPNLCIPTPSVYKALKAQPLSDKMGPRALTAIQADLSIFVSRLQEGERARVDSAVNDLIPAAVASEPRLEQLHRHLERHFKDSWRMSGSGSSHFLVFDHNRAKQEEIQARFQQIASLGIGIFETTTVHP